MGRVTIPIGLYKSAEHVDDVSLKTLHEPCGSPLKQDRNCPNCSTKSPVVDPELAQTISAYEFAPGQFVRVDRAKLEAAIAGNKRVVLDRTVPAGDITAPMIDETYFLGPSSDPNAMAAYAALMQALERTGLAGVGRIALGMRERLAAVGPVTIEGVTILGLTTLFPVAGVRVAHATEIRDQIDQAGGLQKGSVDLFADLLNQLHSPEFQWRATRRFYPSRLRRAIDAARKRGTVIVAPQVDSVAPQDLGEALRASAAAVGKPKTRTKTASKA